MAVIQSEWFSYAATLLAGVLGDRLVVRRQRATKREEHAQDAAALLIPAVKELRRLVRESDHQAQPSQAWTAAWLAFTDAYDDVGHRLPDGWRHLERSVRAAIGTFVGGIAASDSDTRMRDYAVAPHDEEWRRNADDYLDYALHSLRTWNDEPARTGRAKPLLAFDPWLKRDQR